jgi:hypothetical protein
LYFLPFLQAKFEVLMDGCYTYAELQGILLCTNWGEDFEYSQEQDKAHGALNESDEVAEEVAEEAAAIFDVAAEEALIGLGELHHQVGEAGEEKKEQGADVDLSAPAGPGHRAYLVWAGSPINTTAEQVVQLGELEGEVEGEVEGDVVDAVVKVGGKRKKSG